MKRGRRTEEEGTGGGEKERAHTNLISCILCGSYWVV